MPLELAFSVLEKPFLVLWRVYCLPVQMAFRTYAAKDPVKCFYDLIHSPQQQLWGGAIIVLISELRKLRVKKFSSVPKVTEVL